MYPDNATNATSEYPINSFKLIAVPSFHLLKHKLNKSWFLTIE